MKPSLKILGLITFCAVSCLAQPTPKPPSTPAKPANPASAEAPTPPARPVAIDNDVAENLRRVDEELVRLNLGDVARFNLLDPFGDRDESARTLIINQDAGQAKNQSDTEEDLNVMAHILEKASASRDERNARAIGITFRSPFGRSPALRNLYLEGYGAIFFLNVSYSLTPPSSKPDEPDIKEATPSEWEEARRELTHSGGGRHINPPEQSYGPDWSGAREYDAEKVDSLKKNLAQALKNAAHIRNLKADETVTIVITGRSPSSAIKPAKVKNTSKTVSDARSSGEKLIIRARKSDIEEFQNEKLSFEDFRKRLVIFPG